MVILAGLDPATQCAHVCARWTHDGIVNEIAGSEENLTAAQTRGFAVLHVHPYTENPAMLQGSCLCGAVAYESAALSSPIGLCHCRTCQKAHASAYAPTARTPRAGFKWTKGEDVVAAFESSPGKNRWFCPRCGTHLMAEWKTQDQVILRVGSLDTPLDQKPVVHIWMSHANPTLEAPEGIPKLPEGRPS